MLNILEREFKFIVKKKPLVHCTEENTFDFEIFLKENTLN